MVEQLTYPLQGGYIHNWLVAGPQAVPLASDEYRQEPAEVVQQHYRRISDIHQPPLERAEFQVGEQTLTWRYSRCLEDHLVDLSAFYPTPHYLRAWAYCQLVSETEQQVTFTVTGSGPLDLWINRGHLCRIEYDGGQDRVAVTLEGVLQQGSNEVLVRFETVAVNKTSYVMAMGVDQAAASALTVELPVQHTNVTRRLKLERVFEQAHLEHLVSVRGANIAFRWDDEADINDELHYWLEREGGMAVLFGQDRVQAGVSKEVGPHLLNLEQDRYNLVFAPPSHVIERFNIYYRKYRPLYVLEHPYADVPYGTYDERRREALEHCATREGQLYAEIAKLPLGRWAAVDQEIVSQAAQRAAQRWANSVLDLVGLLGALQRYPDRPAFLPQTQQAIRDAARAFRYWDDRPGLDAMRHEQESQAILFHTCEILAGQAYPDLVFEHTGQTGAWHRERGEQLSTEWLHQRGTTGFEEWDSNCCFEHDLVALSHLHDLAENEQVLELAAVVMDKLFYTMAVNSFKGIFGSTHGRTNTQMVKSGQLEATSGIGRLMWGLGVWNEHIRGLVALACSDYELPPTLPAIAADPSELWEKEHHGIPGVNKITYRTADYMLASAQDYRPGERGCEEHIWQATLGPDAVVFATHPPLMSEADVHQPNFWAGNAVLPRVAQWKDILVAVHNLPADDWMGFTHAHFPVYEFDEYVLGDRWAFGRKGDGYVALTAAQGLELVKRGPGAYRELRSYGQENVWLCQMGRAAADGSFEEFQRRVLALDVRLQGLTAEAQTLRGQRLSFGWQGPFRVDGEEQPLSGFRHYEGPYCVADLPADQMDINFAGYLLRLDFRI